MKYYTYTILILILFVCTTNAQKFAKQGTVEIGGGLSYSSTSETINRSGYNSDFKQFTLIPYVGYFVTDGLQIGVIPFAISNMKTNYSDVTQFQFFFAPAYNVNTNSNLFPFIEARVGYSTSNNGSTRISGISYGAQVGVKIKLNQGALLNIGVSNMWYNATVQNSSAEVNTDKLAFEIGFSVFL